MNLSQIQDMGGCRAVLKNIDAVLAVNRKFDSSRAAHVLVRQDDYIFDKPKPSGYRGVHLIFEYRSAQMAKYQGHRIEVQLRTRLQHAWATAVETVGTFTQQALKSSRGEDKWLRFFVLVSAQIASLEGAPPPAGIDVVSTNAELKALAVELNLVDRLTAYGEALKLTESQLHTRDRFAVLDLDTSNTTHLELSVNTFQSNAQAVAAYETLERSAASNSKRNVVLVSVDSMHSLRRAYPNYFLDTSVFVGIVKDVLV